ncbi:FAD-dependent oxidoreductase [archaeon]|nr:FAD-dependent oxidoreductase [archaeon]
MHDVIIIGGGISGFTAAMYAGRLGLKTLIVEAGLIGGVITTTNIVENWPGIKKISGEELAMSVVEHAKEYDIDIETSLIKKVKIGGKKGCFTVSSGSKTFESKTVIFATGAKHKKHPAKNADKFENKGVHYCALCDGPIYRGKKVAVIGGSDSAAKEALFLSEFASEVHMLVRGEKLLGEKINNERLTKNKKITVHTNTNIVEMKGDLLLDTLVIEGKNKRTKEFKVHAAFVAIGIIPLSELAEGIGVKLNKKKEIIIDRTASTNIKGVFACGDVTDTKFKQAITGAGEAVTASYWAYAYVNDPEYVCPRGEEKP